MRGWTWGAIVLLPLSAWGQTPPGDDDGSEEEPEGEAEPETPTPPTRPKVQRPEIPLEGGMLRIPGGRFTMGGADRRAQPNERPPHPVVVAPFWIDRTEVTVGAFRACVARRACAPPHGAGAACLFAGAEVDLPVNCVTWQDAERFCSAHGKRLPREAEWEFAARGEGGAIYPWGSGFTHCGLAVTLVHEATGKSCSGRKPARVGAHPGGASAFGVLDLAGNVEEWTADWYGESPGAAPRAGASHVLRGGGWLSPPSAARASARNWGSAVEAGPNVGFRCARDDLRPRTWQEP